MKNNDGYLTVIAQAVSSGVKAGPYRIDVFGGHEKRLPKDAQYSATAVLGSPTRFKVSPGKYTIRVRNTKEGEFIERITVKDKEIVLPISVGRTLARSYNDLMVEMAPLQKKFESFVLALSQDSKLQRQFVTDPDAALRENKLLPSGARISRKNRLFIALLANKELRQLVRSGDRQIKVPGDFRKRQSPKVKRILQKYVLDGRHPPAELVDVSIRRRYFFQAVVTAILTEPVLKTLYQRTFSRKEVDLLFEATYEFADRADPTSAAMSLAASTGPGIAAVITFSILNINAGVAVNSSAAIFVDGGIFTKSYVFSNSYIFTSTKVVCSLSPSVAFEAGIADEFDLFQENTVSPKLSQSFKLAEGQINEIFNFATIADAIVEGMNVMDYESALAYARERFDVMQ